MKVYTAGLIDRSLRSANNKLQKNLTVSYQKTLHVPKKAVSAQELNSFMILYAEKNKTVDEKTINELEKGKLHNRLQKYYNENESSLQRQLKNDQELHETSKIVKDFIKEIDPTLVKGFNSQLKHIIKTLPTSYRKIQTDSYAVIWDLSESHQFRFYLSGIEKSTFTGSNNNDLVIDELVDKLVIANFFAAFLKPTTDHLKELSIVLEKLKEEVEGKHYKTTDLKLQKKLDLFLRILAAKLSALQDLDNIISRIFKLFQVPYETLTICHFTNGSVELNKKLETMKAEITEGQALLQDLSKKIIECQIHLRDYQDPQKNGIQILEHTADLKKALFPLADLSTNLFVEAELLKMWSDFFGTDIPYFRFSNQLFNAQNTETTQVEQNTIIAVRNLTKNYNLGRTTVYALRGVTLDIQEGDFVAIIGSSGAGKTTLLNCMAGLDSPDLGTVLFRGQNLHKIDDSSKSKIRLKDMGFIFQSYALLPHFTAKENIALPADLSGFSKDLKERIEKLLRDVGLSNQAKQYPATLSGGQMQRVAIARALTNNPAVIFADEPTGDLDSQTGKQVMELLKKFHEETKTTIVVITHSQDVADYAKTKITMEDGIVLSD